MKIEYEFKEFKSSRSLRVQEFKEFKSEIVK